MSQQSPEQTSSPVLPKRSNRNIAMLLIVAGAIILLYNSGALGSILFSTLMPIVLIAFGFDLLTDGVQRRRAITGALLASVVLTPFVAVAHLVAPERPRSASNSSERDYIGTVEDIDQVRAHVRLTAGQLSIGGLSRGNREVVAFESEGGQEPEFHRENRVAFLDINRPVDDNLELEMTRDVPLDLTLELGAVDATPLDFEDIKLEKLDLTLGAGRAEITLPDEGVMDITISGVAGEVELEVPDDLAARIEVSASVGNIDVDDRFQLQDGVYVTEDYSDEAENRATIRVTTTAGNIVIR
jgi:predicted membrane protein